MFDKARRPALIFLGLQLAVAGAGGEVLHRGGDRGQASCVGLGDHRGDQAARDRDRDRDVGALEADEVVAGILDVAFGHLDQCGGERLDHQVVDRQLDPAAVERRR
jgi:hypothetical protein